MTSMMAVDPGKMTGYWVAGYGLKNAGGIVEGSGGQLPHEDFLDFFSNAVQKVDIVVCESFTITQRSMTQRGERMWSIEQIGVMRWLCRLYSVPYVEQSPSDAKSFATDKKLKKIGWYVSGQEHCRDATRHALLWLVRNGHVYPHVLLDSVD